MKNNYILVKATESNKLFVVAAFEKFFNALKVRDLLTGVVTVGELMDDRPKYYIISPETAEKFEPTLKIKINVKSYLEKRQIYHGPTEEYIKALEKTENKLLDLGVHYNHAWLISKNSSDIEDLEKCGVKIETSPYWVLSGNGDEALPIQDMQDLSEYLDIWLD